jgi:hypothetical protein
MLEGSVRRSERHVRVNARLIDAEADAPLWAERFDSDISELFALQDDVTSRISVALNLELINAEAARQPEHPGALDYIFQGRAVLFKPSTRESYLRSIDFFERAIEIDARSAEARSRLSGVFSSRAIEGMTDTRSNDRDIGRKCVGTAADILKIGQEVPYFQGPYSGGGRSCSRLSRTSTLAGPEDCQEALSVSAP